MVLLVAAALAGPPATAPVVGCAQRIEGGRPIATSLPGDVKIGPIRFSGLEFVASADPKELTPRRGRRWAVVKAAPVVEAGAPVTVVVPAAERPHFRVAWAGGSGSAATFVPCKPSTHALSYRGTVGTRTAWAGGFLVDGPGCRRLEVWVRGRARPLTRVLRFGKARCP